MPATLPAFTYRPFADASSLRRFYDLPSVKQPYMCAQACLRKLTGRPIDAAEAYRAGFVTRVCASTDELWKAADEYAGWFAATSPLAARLGRRAFTLLADLPANQALDAAQFMNLTFFLGSDLAEGATAFLEKRPPSWVHPEENPDA